MKIAKGLGDVSEKDNSLFPLTNSELRSADTLQLPAITRRKVTPRNLQVDSVRGPCRYSNMMSFHALYEPMDLAKVISTMIPTSSCSLRLSRTRRISEESRRSVSAAAIAVSSPRYLHGLCHGTVSRRIKFSVFGRNLARYRSFTIFSTFIQSYNHALSHESEKSFHLALC